MPPRFPGHLTNGDSAFLGFSEGYGASGTIEPRFAWENKYFARCARCCDFEPRYLQWVENGTYCSHIEKKRKRTPYSPYATDKNHDRIERPDLEGFFRFPVSELREFFQMELPGNRFPHRVRIEGLSERHVPGVLRFFQGKNRRGKFGNIRKNPLPKDFR